MHRLSLDVNDFVSGIKYSFLKTSSWTLLWDFLKLWATEETGKLLRESQWLQDLPPLKVLHVHLNCKFRWLMGWVQLNSNPVLKSLSPNGKHFIYFVRNSEIGCELRQTLLWLPLDGDINPILGHSWEVWNKVHDIIGLSQNKHSTIFS